jgi:hypothetical protein
MMTFQTELSREDNEKINRRSFYFTLAVAIIFAVIMAVVNN